jgi:hypothetical protein
MDLARQVGLGNYRVGLDVMANLAGDRAGNRQEAPFTNDRSLGDGQSWGIGMSHISTQC